MCFIVQSYSTREYHKTAALKLPASSPSSSVGYLGARGFPRPPPPLPTPPVSPTRIPSSGPLLPATQHPIDNRTVHSRSVIVVAVITIIFGRHCFNTAIITTVRRGSTKLVPTTLRTRTEQSAGRWATAITERGSACVETAGQGRRASAWTARRTARETALVCPCTGWRNFGRFVQEVPAPPLNVFDKPFSRCQSFVC